MKITEITKKTAAGIAIASGIYLIAAISAPSAVEYFANRSSTMERCKSEVKENMKAKATSNLENSLLGYAQRAPLDAPKRVFNETKTKALDAANKYIDAAFREGRFEIKLNKQNAPAFYSPERFNPVNYNGRLIYTGTPLANFNITNAPTWGYTAVNIYIWPNNPLEKAIGEIAKSAAKTETFNEFERQAGELGNKVKSGYNSIKETIKEKLK